MTKWSTARIAMATALFGLVAAASSHAWVPSHENKLTFNKPVALPGVVLPAGSYSFDLADSNSNLDIVVVRNATRTKLFYMGFTRQVERPKNLPANAMISLGESPAGKPAPVAAWYPIGESTGHQFLYR